MTTIDAKDMVLGRIASVIAERLLKGETIEVVNSEKSVIVGRKEPTMEKFRTRVNARVWGNPDRYGPKYPRKPNAIFKRTIRGMVPDKKERGKNALKKLKVFIGVPKEKENQKFEIIEKAKNHEMKKFLYLEEISKELGAKW